MNKYKLRYILDYIQEVGGTGVRLQDILVKENVLECFGSGDLLNETEKLVVRGELHDLAECERFKERHQLSRRP